MAPDNPAIWRRLVTPELRALLEALSLSEDPASPSLIARLRKTWPAELVNAGIDLTLARRKAVDKFERPDELIADPEAVEQATGIDVARYKAHRYREAGLDAVMDLCCGMGGDAMAMAEVGRVILVDLNPFRIWAARRNVAGAGGVTPPGIAADVASIRLPDMPFHIDPQRRDASGARRHRFNDGYPGGAFLRALIARFRDGAVKLSPGVDLDTLPEGEVEVINRNGRLTQTVLWTGHLALNGLTRSATRLPEQIRFSGLPDLPVACAEAGRYLLDVDPAVERAGLTGALCRSLGLPALHPALGLLTADHRPETPWLTAYERLETLPWHEKKIRQWLKTHQAGEVVIKTRDRVVDPERLSKSLRGEGSQTFVLFIMRVHHKISVWITRRVCPDVETD